MSDCRDQLVVMKKMSAFKRSLVWLVVMALMFGASPLAVGAAQPDLKMIDNRVLLAAPFAPESSPFKLLVQATSLQQTPYRYLVTISNLTPWQIADLQLRDRYLPADPLAAELSQLWLPGPVAPGQAISFVFEYPDGPLPNACHQLEIHLAEGVDTILMDCSAPNATTIWEVALTVQMQAILALPPLTLVTPIGSSKVGLHVARNASPAVMMFIRATKPAVVVSMDDLDWLSEVKQISPNTITLGRFIEGDQSFVGDPVVRAREFVNDQSQRFLANPGVDYWLGWNEPTIDSVADMTWFAAFEAERTRAMAELGLRVAIGNFSTGVPEADEFEAFLPAVAAAKQYGGILALHEYSAPTLRDGLNAGIPGAEAINGAGALTLRYRYWYDHYLRTLDLVIPLVITELGIDGGVLAPVEVNRGGWRDFLDSSVFGVPSPEATASYLEQLSWYDDELRRDPYVIGFAIFNAGTPNGRWATFDITEILPQLAGLVNSKG
ncbi:MAG: hypothetical protein ACYCZF_02645 [Anaerolineae bacterium]